MSSGVEEKMMKGTRLKLHQKCALFLFPIQLFSSLSLSLSYLPKDSSFITAIFFIVMSSQNPQKQPPAAGGIKVRK
jgi:hypothetical protein